MSRDGIRLVHLTKRFGPVTAVDSISLDIRAGEFFSLLGPSGCGKTTLLRLIAGLELPDSGQLEISGREMTRLPPQKRPVHTVFQSYALFPHLTVFDNVAFALRMQQIPSAEIQTRVAEAMELVHISELAKRFPHQISGGQKQRVALARALINRPEVLLLDEPLAAIDAKLRKQLQSDLKELQSNLGTTFIYVTHDQDEALAMSDRIAVMRSGKIEQLGTPEAVYQSPATEFAATFLGHCNLLRGTVLDPKTVQTPVGPLHVRESLTNKTHFMIGIRPENVRLATATETENTFTGTVVESTYSGAQRDYLIKTNQTIVKVVLLSSFDATAQFKKGDEVRICLPSTALFLLSENG